MASCPICKEEFKEGFRSCPHCGASVTLPRRRRFRIFRKLATGDAAAGLNISIKAVGIIVAAIIGVAFVVGIISTFISDSEETASGTAVLQPLEQFTLDDEDAQNRKARKRTRTAEDEINDVFAAVSRANLTEDIDLFMSHYASTFPGREQKREKTLEQWERYDYLSLDFFVYDSKVSGETAEVSGETAKVSGETAKVSGERAEVSVGWEIAFREKGQTETRVLETTNDVKLVKENGKWRISSFK